MFGRKKCYCPGCKSLLNLQFGFSPKNEKHTCTECGRIVNVVTGEFPKDEEEEELYFGDFSVKEGKYGESDNEKTAPLPKIPPDYKEAPPQYEDDYIVPPPEEEQEAPPPPPPPPEQAVTADEDEDSLSGVMAGLQKWKKSHLKPLMYAKLGAFAIVLILIGAFLLSNLVPVGYDSDTLIGMDKRSVTEMLERQGFSRVKTKALEDLGYDQIDQENIVRSIDIDDVSEFTSKKSFLKWKKIVIYYSSLQKKSLPISSKDIKDVNYKDLEKMFRGAGFINVTTEADADLKTGWINFDGEVEDVYVDNKSKFSANDKYRPDIEIIIVYHTFPA